MDVGTATDTGRQRRHNEDHHATYVPNAGSGSTMDGLLLVADGMGGELGGAEASRLAVDKVLEELSSESKGFYSGFASRQEVIDTLRKVIRETSDRIFRIGQENSELHGLGTTLVTVAFRGEEALVAHVGDSRCYRIRQGKVECLTSDHTWIARQIEAGELTPEEAKVHPQKGVLLRALGDAVSPGVDVRAEAVEDDDLFVLCSDGLSNALSDSEILQIAKRFLGAQDLAEALVALANDKDGSDNVTAVVCRCRDATRLQADPEDTEPIFVPPRRRPVASRRRTWSMRALVATLLLFLVVALPRIIAVQAFERGKELAHEGKFLHARREFAKAMSLGLDRKRANELIDILLRLSQERSDAEPERAYLMGGGPPTRPKDIRGPEGGSH